MITGENMQIELYCCNIFFKYLKNILKYVCIIQKYVLSLLHQITIKHTTMKTAELKNKVIAKLITGGNNVEDVNNMVAKHFEYAASKYSTVKTICECIRTIY